MDRYNRMKAQNKELWRIVDEIERAADSKGTYINTLELYHINRKVRIESNQTGTAVVSISILKR